MHLLKVTILQNEVHGLCVKINFRIHNTVCRHLYERRTPRGYFQLSSVKKAKSLTM